LRAAGFLILLGVVASSGALTGCASTDTSASFAMAPVAEPQLPETVAVIPTFNSSEGDHADAARSLAMEQATDVSVTPVSYAGPTPSATAALAAEAFPAAPQQDGAAAQPAAAVKAAVVPAAQGVAAAAEPAGQPGTVDSLIAKYAAIYELPEAFVRRVVKRESTFNPKAFNKGHWGLMQIKHATARGMGYDGPAKGLLDAETNLKYAVKYLRGAYLVAAGNEDRADKLYQRGYYYDAKRAGLLDETGLGKDRVRRRLKPI